MWEVILPALIGAGGDLLGGMMGGSSVKDAKRLMYYQQKYWVDRFRAQTAQQRRFMKDFGPQWQFRQDFRGRMKMADKYGIHKLAMLRGGGGSVSPPMISGSQPSAGSGIPEGNNALQLAIMSMGQNLAKMTEGIIKQLSKEKNRGNYEIINAKEFPGASEKIESHMVTEGPYKRIKIIPQEKMGEAYDASPFQKTKGAIEEFSDWQKIRHAWKYDQRQSRMYHNLVELKKYLIGYFEKRGELPKGWTVVVDGENGNWYKIQAPHTRLWLNPSPRKKPYRKIF